jgi:hypothetical protein
VSDTTFETGPASAAEPVQAAPGMTSLPDAGVSDEPAGGDKGAETPRRCVLCDRTDPVPPERTPHGACLLRRAFGPLAAQLVPEDLVRGDVTPDGGLDYHDAGVALEMLIYKSTADDIAAGEHLSRPLEERRDTMASVIAFVTGDVETLARHDPATAVKMAIMNALRENSPLNAALNAWHDANCQCDDHEAPTDAPEATAAP